jgi:hypothetical protein
VFQDGCLAGLCARKFYKRREVSWLVQLASQGLSSMYLDGYWFMLRGGIVQSIPCTASVLLYCDSQSEFYSFLIRPPELFSKYQQRHLRSREKLGEECPFILPAKYLYHTPQGSLTCRKIL